jgi:hypothetical protein
VHRSQRVGVFPAPAGAVRDVGDHRHHSGYGSERIVNAAYAARPVPSPRRRFRVDEVTLAAVMTAMSSVYCFVHITMQDWGLFHLLPDAERIAVELVAYAVEQTGICDGEPHWTEITNLPTIGVRVSVDNGVVLIQVRDCDRRSPMPEQGTYLDQHLAVVHELCSTWNWYPVDGGRVIWAEVTPRPAEPPGPLPHPDLLQAVLDGLHRLGTEGSYRGEL